MGRLIDRKPTGQHLADGKSMQSPASFRQDVLHAASRKPFIAGLVIVAALCAIVCAMGEKAAITPHDQLDGETIVYLLHALHPFDQLYPEILGGIPAGNMVMASPGTVLFYLAFEPCTAFIANLCFVMIVSYVGMYACLRAFEVAEPICLCTSVLFACIPIYSVYGLSVMGVPLMVLAANLAYKEHLVSACALSIFYGIFSSPFLCGYAVFIACAITAFALFLRGSKAAAKRVFVLCVVLALTYIATNFYALYCLAVPPDGPTHKTEVTLTPTQSSLSSVLTLYFDGKIYGSSVFYHAEANQRWLAAFSLIVTAVAVVCLLWRRQRQLKDSGLRKLLGWIVALQLLALGIAVFYCAFHSQAVVDMRNSLPGALRSFQFDRFYWLYPTIWYLCAGLAAELLLRIAGHELLARLAASLLIAVTAGLAFWADWQSSDVFATAKIAVGKTPTSGKVTWGSFYATEAFDEVKAEMDQDFESYRVSSIGMHPSVAAMNGLLCLDGYLNTYPLRYKHSFRTVIADELSADDALRRYFDEWGNRCYAFSHEVGRNYLVRKDSDLSIRDLRMNLEAFADLGGRYLVSSVPIEACESYGLEEVAFSDAGASIYGVHVYEVSL